jgi:starvation-inducible DNA-binding protein
MAISEAPSRNASAPDSGNVAGELRPTLLELIDLSLIAKQAHWNVTGPLFRPLHQHFDEIADAARGWADDVAERIEAIGESADGRSNSIATGSGLAEMPEGKLDGATAAQLVVERLGEVGNRIRGRVQRLAESDPLSQDVLIELGRGLEKELWMLREQTA